MDNLDILKAQDAEKVLNNPAWKDAWSSMHKSLDRKILNCDTIENKNQAADIVRCKQLLDELEREFTLLIENGQMAAIEIKDAKKSKVERVFNRDKF